MMDNMNSKDHGLMTQDESKQGREEQKKDRYAKKRNLEFKKKKKTQKIERRKTRTCNHLGLFQSTEANWKGIE
jgi:hypothetical protein